MSDCTTFLIEIFSNLWIIVEENANVSECPISLFKNKLKHNYLSTPISIFYNYVRAFRMDLLSFLF